MINIRHASCCPVHALFTQAKVPPFLWLAPFLLHSLTTVYPALQAGMFLYFPEIVSHISSLLGLCFHIRVTKDKLVSRHGTLHSLSYFSFQERTSRTANHSYANWDFTVDSNINLSIGLCESLSWSSKAKRWNFVRKDPSLDCGAVE